MPPRIDGMAAGTQLAPPLGTPIVTKGPDANRPPSSWEAGKTVSLTGPAAAESNKGIDSGLSQVRTPDPTPNRPPRTPRGADVVEMMRGGGSKEAGPMPTPGLDAENTESLAQGGQQFSAGLTEDVDPVAMATPARPGNAENIAKGPGIAGGKPPAGDGPGTGRQPQTVIGQTLAKPRSQGGGFLPPSRK